MHKEMNIHAANLCWPVESSPEKEAPRTARFHDAARVEVPGGRGEKAAWEPQVSVGAEKPAGLAGRVFRPAAQSQATGRFLGQPCCFYL